MSRNRHFPTPKVASVPAGTEFKMPPADEAEESFEETVLESADVSAAEEPDTSAATEASAEKEETTETVVEAPVPTPPEEPAPVVAKEDPLSLESNKKETPPTVSKAVESESPVIVTTEKGKIDMNVQHQLEQYAEAMAVGKPVKPEEGGQRQYGLYKLIKSILATEDQSEFTTKFNTLLSFVKANKTKVFSENYVFRFPSQWTGSESEFTNFRRIVTVILASSDPATRTTDMASVNMEVAMEGFSEKEKNKLIVFYNL
jgi:hypothetical protein